MPSSPFPFMKAIDGDGTFQKFWVVGLLLFVLFGGLFCVLAIGHLRYPGFTETMEGDILQQIERIARGAPPYPKADGTFVALPYLPLYPLVAAPLYRTFGDTLFVSRLISVVCALLAGGLIVAIGRRETGGWGGGLLAGALFFAGYRLMDAYLTCGLPDTMMLLWLLVGFWFFAYGKGEGGDLLWMGAFTLAFWTKQQAALLFALVVGYAVVLRRNAFPRTMLIVGWLVGVPLAYLLVGQDLGEGFFEQTWRVPLHWDRSIWFSVRRFLFVSLCQIPFLLLLSGLYTLRCHRRVATKSLPLLWFSAATVVVSLVTMMVAGSSNNHYIPMIAILSVTAAGGVLALLEEEPSPSISWIMGGVAIGVTTMTLLSRWLTSGHEIRLNAMIATVVVFLLLAARRRWRVPLLRHRATPAFLLLAGHLATAFYSPKAYLPPAGFEAARADFQRFLAEIAPETVWTSYGNVPVALSGVKMARAPSWVALEDLERQRRDPEEVEAALSPFLERFQKGNWHLLTSYPIDRIPVWRRLAGAARLVEDLGERFAPLEQIVPHWFRSRTYPRYHYRLGEPAGDSPSSLPR